MLRYIDEVWQNLKLMQFISHLTLTKKVLYNNGELKSFKKLIFDKVENN